MMTVHRTDYPILLQQKYTSLQQQLEVVYTCMKKGWLSNQTHNKSILRVLNEHHSHIIIQQKFSVNIKI